MCWQLQLDAHLYQCGEHLSLLHRVCPSMGRRFTHQLYDPAWRNPGSDFEVDATALPGDEWAFGNIEFLTEDMFAGGDPVVLVEQDFTEETFPPTVGQFTMWTLVILPHPIGRGLSTSPLVRLHRQSINMTDTQLQKGGLLPRNLRFLQLAQPVCSSYSVVTMWLTWNTMASWSPPPVVILLMGILLKWLYPQPP